MPRHSALGCARQVPVFANQWGIKRSVSEERGRLRYARDVASLFEEHAVHSALWIWRSYRSEHWGFELVHETETRRESEDVWLMNLLNKVWCRRSLLKVEGVGG